jgi:hypothetical protein
MGFLDRLFGRQKAIEEVAQRLGDIEIPDTMTEEAGQDVDSSSGGPQDGNDIQVPAANLPDAGDSQESAREDSGRYNPNHPPRPLVGLVRACDEAGRYKEDESNPQ